MNDKAIYVKMYLRESCIAKMKEFFKDKKHLLNNPIALNFNTIFILGEMTEFYKDDYFVKSIQDTMHIQPERFKSIVDEVIGELINELY